MVAIKKDIIMLHLIEELTLKEQNERRESTYPSLEIRDKGFVVVID